MTPKKPAAPSATPTRRTPARKAKAVATAILTTHSPVPVTQPTTLSEPSTPTSPSAPPSPPPAAADTADDLDLDALLAKATVALKERQANTMCVRNERGRSFCSSSIANCTQIASSLTPLTDPSAPATTPLATVRLDPGFDIAELPLSNSGKKYGAVTVIPSKVAALRIGANAVPRTKVQEGVETFAVVQPAEALPPSLDWTPKQKKAMTTETSGPKWFDMPAPELTDALKRDLHILKSRPVIDPKRHYKKNTMAAPPKYFQIGTIIQGPTEYHSARMTRKERRDNIVDELMADTQSRQYFKRKFLSIQEEKGNVTRKGWKKGKGNK
ncbi:Fcf2 pre-rRNA processing-domain-containing protein [Geranomyces variabilis]|nr:Fcf2 pre-rRNA processing-domain-containing protein [Geranomyces variabilis]